MKKKLGKLSWLVFSIGFLSFLNNFAVDEIRVKCNNLN